MEIKTNPKLPKEWWRRLPDGGRNGREVAIEQRRRRNLFNRGDNYTRVSGFVPGEERKRFGILKLV